MRNLLLERRILNEGYFNNIEQGVDVDDIIDSGKYVEITEDETLYKYYFEIVYASSSCRQGNLDEPYNVNIKLMYDKISKIFDRIDIVYDYYIAPPVIYDTNNYFKPKEFKFPLPEEFDIIGYIDSVNGNKYSALPKYTFRIYFNNFPKYSFNSFRRKIEQLKRLCFKMFMEYPTDGGSITLYDNDGTYVVPMVYHKKSIGYEIGFTLGLINSSVRYLYNDIYKTNIEGDSDYDEQIRISKHIDLKTIVDNAVKISKEQYGFELHPVNQHKATFKPWQDVFTWLSFDLKFPKGIKDVDIFTAEQVVYDSIIKQIPFEYMRIITLMIFIRVDGKLSIPEDDKEKNGRLFNLDTIRHYHSLAFKCGYNRTKSMPKIRKCMYRSMGSGSEFFIFFCDKKGNIMRNYDNFHSNYSKMYFDDTVLKCLRDGEAWN